MPNYLLISDHGINTKPVSATTDAELIAAFQAEAGEEDALVGAIELQIAADMAADGSVPPEFTTAQTNRAALIAKAEQALATNQAFLALASPTNAQSLAQIQALTRECNGLIRLVLGKLDLTDGT